MENILVTPSHSVFIRWDVPIGHGHPVISEGLRSRILAEEDIEFVVATTDGEEAAIIAKELRPDVAVIDIIMCKSKTRTFQSL